MCLLFLHPSPIAPRLDVTHTARDRRRAAEGSNGSDLPADTTVSEEGLVAGLEFVGVSIAPICRTLVDVQLINTKIFKPNIQISRSINKVDPRLRELLGPRLHV